MTQPVTVNQVPPCKATPFINTVFSREPGNAEEMRTRLIHTEGSKSSVQ